MQGFYQMPFEPFERYSPYGTPEQVAEFLSPYIDAGCSAFNVIPCASNAGNAIDALGEVRRLLSGRSVPPSTSPTPRDADRQGRGGASLGAADGIQAGVCP
jgi:hypothetical protein